MKKKNRVSSITCIYGISAVLVLILILYLGVLEKPDLFKARKDYNYREVMGYQIEERSNEEAPVGVEKVYSWTLDEVKKEDNCLAFYVVHQYVDVYFDDELLYHLGQGERTSMIKTTGSNWVIIPLFQEDQGKNIRVVVKPVYKNFIDWKIDFFIGTRLSIFLDRLKKDLPQLVLGILAVLVGVVFCCLAVYHFIWKKYDDRLAVLGIAAIFVGIWRLTDTRFSPMVFSSKPTFLLYLSFIMLMIGIVPLVKSVQFRFDEENQKPFHVLCVLAAVSCMIQTLLQLFGVMDLRRMLIVTHILIVLFAIILIGSIVREVFHTSKEGKCKLRIFLICGVGAFADVIAYYIKGNSSGLLFTLAAFLLYVVLNGIITLEGYKKQEKRLEEQEKELAKQEKELAEQEKELAESRISIMMSQIQPHFLYNSLNIIYHLCGKNPQKAQQAINDFSEYLRGNLDSLKRKTLVSFETELRHTEVYLSLEKMRFEEELCVVYNIQTKDFMIPSLAMQPLVENAVKYGVGQSERGGTVTIATKEYDEFYEISVEDDGVGYDTEQEVSDNRSHIGIENVRKRLWTMCQATLTIDSIIGKGTKAVIKLPKGEETGNYSSR